MSMSTELKNMTYLNWKLFSKQVMVSLFPIAGPCRGNNPFMTEINSHPWNNFQSNILKILPEH